MISVVKNLLKMNQPKLDFLRAVVAGDFNVVKSAISSDKDLLRVTDFHKRNALMLASREGHLNIVELFIDRISPNIVDLHYWSALMHACSFNHVDVVRLLLAYGADPNATDSYGWTVLQRSCCYNFIDVVRLMLDQDGNPNSADSYGWTALMWGCENVEIIRLLLEHDADVTVRDIYDHSVLMIACIYNSLDSVRLLLGIESVVETIRVRDLCGLSALNYSVRNGKFDITRVLLACGATATEFDLCDCFDHGKLEFISELS